MSTATGTGTKGGGNKGGTACTDGYKGVRAVRPESVAGGGWFEKEKNARKHYGNLA